MVRKITEHQLITQTQIWLENVIVGYNFCPFARREFERGTIHYCVIPDKDIAGCLEALMLECERLDKDKTIVTTLVLYPCGFEQFDDYLRLVEIAEYLLIEQGYEGVYQLASFHPNYCFADSELDDPANYTNRSPAPMLHLIREDSIEQALKSYPHPEEIPQKNIDLARRVGETKMKQMLHACCKSEK